MNVALIIYLLAILQSCMIVLIYALLFVLRARYHNKIIVSLSYFTSDFYYSQMTIMYYFQDNLIKPVQYNQIEQNHYHKYSSLSYTVEFATRL